MQELNGKVALVVGGSSGIGESISKLFGARGAAVAVVASRDLAKSGAVAEAIRASGGSARPYAADVTRIDAIQGLVDSVIRDFGHIDILINCAGVYYPTRLGETSEEAFDQMMATHLKSTFFLVDRVAPHMKQRGSGHIVFLSSAAAFKGVPQYSLYGAVKAAIVMLTKSFAADLARHGVSVNAIAPGNTETPINVEDRLGPNAAEIQARKRAATPTGRVYTPPGEIAEAALFLVSGAVKAIHGITLLIDEGQLSSSP